MSNDRAVDQTLLPHRLRLLIVDDHPVIRSGIRGMLADEPSIEIVGEAASGAEAVAQAAALQPQVVLMDLRMPGMEGTQAIRHLRDAWPDLRVLVLTTYDTDSDILRAIDAGATGYLLKDAPHEELIRAIRAAARGEAVLAGPVAARLIARVRSATEEALSGREIEVLEFVARGLSNREVARALHVSEATVKSHLVHIFGKLGVSDRTAAVSTALDKGIIRLG